MPVQPSQDMLGIREVGLTAEDRDQISASMAPLVAAIETTGDCAMMGWGVLGVLWLVVPTVDTLGRQTRVRPAADFTAGLRSAIVAAAVLGSDLVARGEQLAAAGTNGVAPPTGFSVADLEQTLPENAAAVKAALGGALLEPFAAEVVSDMIASRGDFADRGLLPALARELPGLDLAQAGAGQLRCGNSFFGAGARSAEADAERSRHGRRAARKEAATALARGSGMVMLGALMVLAGECCLAAR